jgi:hypothetical protein
MELVDQATKRATISIDKINREQVRAFVTEECRVLREVSAAGLNVHQHHLDRHDVIGAYVATLPTEDAAVFWQLYAEEMTAQSAAIMDNVAAINAQTSVQLAQNAVQASQVATWVSIVAFFVFLITMISIFKR